MAWSEEGCEAILANLPYISDGWKANQKPPPASLKPIPVTTELFYHVIIDYIGPLLKTNDDNQYLLTIMCVSTRFQEAIPLKTMKALKIVRALVKFFTLVGLPKSVQSDQASNLMSHLFQDAMLQLSIKQVKSSPYFPQSQGKVSSNIENHDASILFSGEQCMGRGYTCFVICCKRICPGIFLL